MILRTALFNALFAVLGTTQAMHLPGGNITYRCSGTNSYEITLTLYRECSGAPMVPQTLHMSNNCGVVFDITGLLPTDSVDVSPLCASELGSSTCNGGALIGLRAFVYHTTVFLSPCDSWTIGWSICCRNTSINVANTPGLWIEARLNNTVVTCDTSPVFNELPVPFVCVDQPVSYDCGTVDTDGNTVRYSFIDARFSAPEPTPVNYTFPFTGAEPFTGMVIDSLTGVITFMPTSIGYIVTAVQVDTYTANGVWIGSVMRDFPFIVQACSNTVPPTTTGALDNATGGASVVDAHTARVCQGGSFCLEAVFTDGDAGQSLTLTSNVGTVFPGASFTVSGTNPATAHICWGQVTADPGTYYISISAMDDACPVRGEQQYVYTVIIDNGPNAGVNSSVTVCSTDPPLDLFAALGGSPDPGGTFTEVSPGIYHYVVVAVGDCPADSSVLTVITVQAPDAGIDNAISICQNNPPILMTDSLLGTPDLGGSWGAPCGVTTSPWFDPSAGTGGITCYNVCSGAPCASASACLSITVIPPTDPACIGLGIRNISMDALSLFPNPSMGLLTLSGCNASRVDLLDLQGRCVWSISQQSTEGVRSIDLPTALANGSYLLRVFEGERSSTHHFDLVR
ncbi:MAG: T9SS type A sorting domain-containing protein [Flavobacteriales bacterium]